MLAAVALSVALYAKAPLYSLRWMPTLHEKARFQTTVDLKRAGVVTTVESTHDHTVVRTDKNGNYTLRTTTTSTLIRSEGQEVRDDRGSTVEIVFSPTGSPVRFLTAVGGDMALRVANMNRFVAPDQPIKVGDSYVLKRLGGETGAGSTETTYTLARVALEALREVAYVSVVYRELEGTKRALATGEWRLDAETASVQSLDLKISGFTTGVGEITSYRLRRI